MLRQLFDKYNDPRFFYGQVTTSGGNAAVVDLGPNDYASAVEAAAGKPVLTLKQPFRRTPVALCAIGTNIANGGYGTIDVASTTAVASLGLLNQAGTAADGTADFLLYGYQSADISRCISQQVLCSKRRSRMLGGKVTTSGAVATVAFGKTDFTVTRTAQGVYSVTFKRAFSQTPIVLPIGISSTVVRAPKVTAKSAAGCTITFYDETQTAQDADWYVIVVGTDIRDEHGLAFAQVDNPQRRPRIIAGQITYTAGVPAATINLPEFSSITDNNTGDATLVLANPFRQECIVMATARNTRVQVHTGSASSPRLICRNAAAAATDPSTVDFLLLGTDDPAEY